MHDDDANAVMISEAQCLRFLSKSHTDRRRRASRRTDAHVRSTFAMFNANRRSLPSPLTPLPSERASFNAQGPDGDIVLSTLTCGAPCTTKIYNDRKYFEAALREERKSCTGEMGHSFHIMSACTIKAFSENRGARSDFKQFIVGPALF